MRVSGLARKTARGAALALTGMALALLPACSALFGFDDYNDSTADLCDLAKKCYDFSGCQGHIAPKLDGAGADERSEWLAAIPSKSCLDSCAKSRKCLNIAPVCSDILSACDKEEECCGFLGGRARCRAMADAPEQGKKCCLPDGVQTLKQEECCSGVYNPKNSACGKNVCRPEGIDCTDDLQCCSQVCRDGKCSEEQCLPLDTPCAATDVCCDGAECLPSTGACGFPNQCRDLREPCKIGDPSTQCCQGLQCLPAVNKHPTGEVYDGLCQDPNAICVPKGYGCETDPCCTNANPSDALECRNGECKLPCSKLDSACSDNGDCCSGKCELTDKGPLCKCAQIYCEDLNDCCSGICIGGVCTAACAPNTVCHDECVPGPALVKADVSKCPKVDPTCVDLVCKVDPFCCCVEWDSTCVTAAVTTCPAKAAVCN